MTQFKDWKPMHVNDIAELTHLRAENARLRSLLDGFRYNGCFSGDCPHEREVECFNVLHAYAEEIGAELEQSEKVSSLVEQVCSYEDALFKIAYPQKSCVGECKCFDLNALKERAQIAFERYNPPMKAAAQESPEYCGKHGAIKKKKYCSKCTGEGVSNE